jgi:UDP-N-acetylmuramate dehydrogenase
MLFFNILAQKIMSLIVKNNVSLKKYNTFGIDVNAQYFAELKSIEDIHEAIDTAQGHPYLILGGGSNVLFTKDFEGYVFINQILGKDILSETEDEIIVWAHSGENWHEFVLWTIENGAFGLENLSLIPGSVGAAPMQNIGAYGTEIKDWCIQVEAIDCMTKERVIFDHLDCKFGYRESVFKHELKNKYIITKVIFKLDKYKKWIPNTNYGDIQNVLLAQGIENPNPKEISNAVIQIRSSKLPNPKELGNAGSFFKNPVIDTKLLENLITKYPQMPNYPDKNGVKVPAGWLIEFCGFKGLKIGNTGSHEKQALVIVNYSNATGSEIFEYSQKIIDTVKDTFGINLEREVNII